MNNMMKSLNIYAVSLMLIALLLTPAIASASIWKIDPEHSNIMFQVRHLGLAEIKGSFRKFEGTVNLDNVVANSSVNVSIDAASIDTGVPKRDEHLKSVEFFEVAKYPAITFVSKRVIPAGRARLKVTGDLTMHGITKEVILNVTDITKEVRDPKGNIRRGLSAMTIINRTDFGLTYNNILPGGVKAIGNKVTIHVEAELVKEK